MQRGLRFYRVEPSGVRIGTPPAAESQARAECWGSGWHATLLRSRTYKPIRRLEPGSDPPATCGASVLPKMLGSILVPRAMRDTHRAMREESTTPRPVGVGTTLLRGVEPGAILRSGMGWVATAVSSSNGLPACAAYASACCSARRASHIGMCRCSRWRARLPLFR